MEQISLSWEPVQPERRLFTVAELNAAIAGVLAGAFSNVWVAGEISGLKMAASGHCYFTLKEEDSQIRCVCFRNSLRLMKAKPRDGLAVLTRGRIEVYEPRGEYQLIVDVLEPQGHGALQLAFEQLKKVLAAEGLFDASRKKPLPGLPRRIGIVSSPSGAVIRDMLNILERRFPGLHIRLYPAQVQGAGSVESVCSGLRFFDRSGWPDVVVVARGGGSLEDLWTFNEESVARAIAASRIPVISAIGHETDFTIADFVADLRAPTPSAAAELLIATRQSLLDRVDSGERQLHHAVRYRLSQAARLLHQLGVDRARVLVERRINRSLQRVDELDYRLRTRVRAVTGAARRRWQTLEARLRRMDMRLRLAEMRRRLERSESALAEIARRRIARAAGRLEPLAAHLTQLSPLKILERGYAVVLDAEGRAVKEYRAAPEGSDLRVRLAKGRLRVKVNESSE